MGKESYNPAERDMSFRVEKCQKRLMWDLGDAVKKSLDVIQKDLGALTENDEKFKDELLRFQNVLKEREEFLNEIYPSLRWDTTENK